jgi:tight adherence protein C
VNASAAALVCGAILGLGLWIVFVRLPVVRRTSFVDRVAPQLRAVDASSRLLQHLPGNLTPFGPLERIVRPLLQEVVHALPRLHVGHAALAKRLAGAGSRKSPVEFRSEQLIWAAAGFAAATVAAVAMSASGRLSPLGGVVMVLATSVVVFVGREAALGQAIHKRRQRILAEFPSIADMMALAVGAGESATAALERTARLSSGALADEFARVLADMRSGTPLIRALQLMSDRVDLAPISRFVDGLVVAIERGTPLADVLRAQAQDVRDLAKRELMEAAGRKEIGMMVPLVFGILPLTILFAVYPGLAAVTLGL